jgi:hypothetical protein
MLLLPITELKNAYDRTNRDPRRNIRVPKIKKPSRKVWQDRPRPRL